MKFEFIQAFMVVLHTCNDEEDSIKREGARVLTFFLIQFNVPFKIISLIETSQSIGGAKQEYPGKTT